VLAVDNVNETDHTQSLVSRTRWPLHDNAAVCTCRPVYTVCSWHVLYEDDEFLIIEFCCVVGVGEVAMQVRVYW